MKQYFSYGAFAVCLLNAVIRPDLFSVCLVGIAAVLVGVSMFQSETKFEAEIRELNQTAEKYYRTEIEEFKKLEPFFSKRLEEVFRRLESLEGEKDQVTKDLTDAKRAIHNFNLANTFVPRAKRNAEL